MALTGLQSTIPAISGAVQDATSLANAVLVTLQGPKYDVLDQSSAGKSFLFSQRGEDSFECSSDIPDHFTEANEPLQDDIAKRPEQITIRGYIGELTDMVPGLGSFPTTVQTQLATLNPLFPTLAVQALELFNTMQQAVQTASAAARVGIEAFDLATGQNYENAQTQAFRYFYSRWDSRSLFTVLTPWGVFQDMAILTMHASQDEDTGEVTQFTITFKRMRFAQAELSSTTVLQGRRATQAAGVVQHGPQSPPYVGAFSPGLGVTDSTLSLGAVA